MNTGPGYFVETVANDEIMNLSFDILNVLKIPGVTELDFGIDERDGKPKLLEINPRFWGSLQEFDFPYSPYEIVIGSVIAVSYDCRTGITGRNFLCNDICHLLMVIWGGFPVSYKLKMMSDFIKFIRIMLILSFKLKISAFFLQYSAITF